jgi:serine protease Do
MRPATRRRFWIGLLMATCFVAGGCVLPHVKVSWEPGKPTNLAFAQTSRVTVGPDEPVAKAVQAIAPSVVNIDTVKRFVQDDWFFGPRQYQSTGAGSGLVIDAKGYVLTNEHVVSGASDINVTFGNGRKFRAEVIGKDHETDVALVRVLNAPTLPAARLGNSHALIPGQWAIAIGNPYGYQQTVTLGVVGHTGRAVRVEDRVYKRLIQTDAAINPGNSGGPLCDIHGNVIGVNTVVRTDAQGIGFAIPIDLAKGIADELILHGKIKRPWTGLNVQDITPDIAQYLGLPSAGGVYVDQIDRRGPAWRAGVRPGDIIRELGGKRMRNRGDVDTLLSSTKIGDRWPILVEREGERYKGEIIVAEKP